MKPFSWESFEYMKVDAFVDVTNSMVAFMERHAVQCDVPLYKKYCGGYAEGDRETIDRDILSIMPAGHRLCKRVWKGSFSDQQPDSIYTFDSGFMTILRYKDITTWLTSSIYPERMSRSSMQENDTPELS